MKDQAQQLTVEVLAFSYRGAVFWSCKAYSRWRRARPKMHSNSSQNNWAATISHLKNMSSTQHDRPAWSSLGCVFNHLVSRRFTSTSSSDRKIIPASNTTHRTRSYKRQNKFTKFFYLLVKKTTSGARRPKYALDAEEPSARANAGCFISM